VCRTKRRVDLPDTGNILIPDRHLGSGCPVLGRQPHTWTLRGPHRARTDDMDAEITALLANITASGN
jgi:hypothetical protein